jgi:hypothetical protein
VTQIGASFLIIAALLVMSPLHHLPLYSTQLKRAIADGRLVVVDFRKMSPGFEKAARTAGTSFITVDFGAVREVLRKQPHPGVRS